VRPERRCLTALIDHVNNLKLQYLVELSKLGDSCAALEAGVAAWLHEHDVIFDGRTIPFVLMPHFVSPGQLRRVRTAVTALCSVLDRFCDAYPDDPALQEELALPEREDELIRIDPGFPRPMRICRLDALMAGYELKFLEFNADSPAGIGYTDILHQGLDTAIVLPRVQAEFDTSYTPILPQVVATLLEAYGHVRARRPDLPRNRDSPWWTRRARRACPSSGSSARRRRQRACRQFMPRWTTSPTTARRSPSRGSRPTSSTGAACSTTSRATSWPMRRGTGASRS
jgi:hypothetical protein